MINPDSVLAISGWHHALVMAGILWVGLFVALIHSTKILTLPGYSPMGRLAGVVICIFWPIVIVGSLVVLAVPKWRHRVFGIRN